MNNKIATKKKINHPDILIGRYLEWLDLNMQQELNGNEFKILFAVLRNSFGYGQEVCYMSYKDLYKYGFNSSNTINKYLNSLVDKKLIKKQQTYINGKPAKNKLTIILPQEITDNYDIVLRKSIKSKTPLLDEFIAKFTHQETANKVIASKSITEEKLKKDKTKEHIYKTSKKYFDMTLEEYEKDAKYIF